MPHRLQIFSGTIAHVIEGSFLSIIAVWQGLSTITDTEFSRLTGQHGYTYALILAVIVLWTSNTFRERRDEKNRERRHNELMATNTANTEELKHLTAESLKVHFKSVESAVEGVAAIRALSNNFTYLTEQLKKRPCQKDQPE